MVVGSNPAVPAGGITDAALARVGSAVEPPVQEKSRALKCVPAVLPEVTGSNPVARSTLDLALAGSFFVCNNTNNVIKFVYDCRQRSAVQAAQLKIKSIILNIYGNKSNKIKPNRG